MTYGVVDLEARDADLRARRPLPADPRAGPVRRRRARPQVLAPDGLVLGLQIDDGDAVRAAARGGDDAARRRRLFVLYTDGITEAMNPAGDCFGEERLARSCEQHARPAVRRAARRASWARSRAFVGAAEQQDDMTMVLLQDRGDAGAGWHA